jgi:hypothetical protein
MNCVCSTTLANSLANRGNVPASRRFLGGLETAALSARRVPDLVPELVPVSGDLTASRGTEAETPLPSLDGPFVTDLQNRRTMRTAIVRCEKESPSEQRF